MWWHEEFIFFPPRDSLSYPRKKTGSLKCPGSGVHAAAVIALYESRTLIGRGYIPQFNYQAAADSPGSGFLLVGGLNSEHWPIIASLELFQSQDYIPLAGFTHFTRCLFQHHSSHPCSIPEEVGMGDMTSWGKTKSSCNLWKSFPYVSLVRTLSQGQSSCKSWVLCWELVSSLPQGKLVYLEGNRWGWLSHCM